MLAVVAGVAKTALLAQAEPVVRAVAAQAQRDPHILLLLLELRILAVVAAVVKILTERQHPAAPAS